MGTGSLISAPIQAFAGLPASTGKEDGASGCGGETRDKASSQGWRVMSRGSANPNPGFAQDD